MRPTPETPKGCTRSASGDSVLWVCRGGWVVRPVKRQCEVCEKPIPKSRRTCSVACEKKRRASVLRNIEALND